MRYALLRRRKQSVADPVARPAKPQRSAVSAEAGEQTVGAVLKAKFGEEYSESWLSSQLGCPATVAADLASYWLPQGPPHLLDRAVGVFANALGLDSQRLAELMRPEGAAMQAPTVIVRSAAPKSAPPRAPRPQQSGRPQQPAKPRPQNDRPNERPNARPIERPDNFGNTLSSPKPSSQGPARQSRPAPQRAPQRPRVAQETHASRTEQDQPLSASRPAPNRVEISIGTAEGVRLIKQSQPTITYRKSRKVVVQA